MSGREELGYSQIHTFKIQSYMALNCMEWDGMKGEE